MNKVKEVIDEISSSDDLKDLKITQFIQSLGSEDYGESENSKYLSNKIAEIISEYGTNGQNRKD